MTRLWREEEAQAIARYATERDPLNTHAIWNLARAQLNGGQYELAEQTMRTFQALNPTSLQAPWSIGLSLLLQSKPEAALQVFVDQVPDDAMQLHGKTLALYELGRIDEYEAALGELIGLKDADDLIALWPFLVATACAWTGNLDDAFKYLEKQRQLNSGIFRVAANSPLYENLKDDPRWLPFLASVELAPEHLASVEFNPRLPVGIHASRTP